MKRKNSFQRKILDLLQQKRVSSTEEIICETVDDFEGDKTLKYRLQRTIKKMADSELIEIHKTNRTKFARLTSKGRRKLRSLRLDDNHSLTPMRWDGFWRIVIISIPENRKDERDSFRYLLKKANFVCIKNSVWASPYPLEHLLRNLKIDLGLANEVMVVVAEQIDLDLEQQLIEKFFRH